jgi:hypothetical protein
MTFEEAVFILNEFKHREMESWHIDRDYPDYCFADEGDGLCSLTEFEAIAVVEKYLREDENLKFVDNPADKANY